MDTVRLDIVRIPVLVVCPRWTVIDAATRSSGRTREEMVGMEDWAAGVDVALAAGTLLFHAGPVELVELMVLFFTQGHQNCGQDSPMRQESQRVDRDK